MNELNFNDLQSILFGIMQTWQDNDILQKGSNEFCTSNLSRNYSGSNSVRKFMNELLMILIILIFFLNYGDRIGYVHRRTLNTVQFSHARF